MQHARIAEVLTAQEVPFKQPVDQRGCGRFATSLARIPDQAMRKHGVRQHLDAVGFQRDAGLSRRGAYLRLPQRHGFGAAKPRQSELAIGGCRPAAASETGDSCAIRP
ncbi:hypothetical protein SIM88_10110 [Cupriavidus necator]|nr:MULTISPECIES: hypothetical protein [Cupriavidus]MDX6009013.1 hypothetical protein [Cupriavidus necator]